MRRFRCSGNRQGMKQPPRLPEGVESKVLREALAGPPVGATGESQGRDRRECESDPAHELHVDSLLRSGCPRSGDNNGIVGGPRLGDKRANGLLQTYYDLAVLQSLRRAVMM